MIPIDPDAYTYKDIVDSLPDGVCVVNAQRSIIYWNAGAERITGFCNQEVLGSTYPGTIAHVDEQGKEIRARACPLETTLSDRIVREADIHLRHKDGHPVPVHVTTAPVLHDRAATGSAVQIFKDNSHKLALLAQIAQAEETALVDPLTGLTNRRFIQDDLTKRVEEKRRYGWPFGVLFVDIDHFKKVNDTYGHAIGDEVLRWVSKTLTQNIRAFDVVGRWGGDEFLVVCRNVPEESIESLADRHRVLIEKSAMSFEDDTLHVTVSIGATVPRPDEPVQSLVERADNLMYHCKQAGRNRVAFSA